MATPELKESEDFLDPALLIPVKGKVYRIEPLSAETVIIMQNARDAARKAEEEGKTAEEITEVKVEGVGEDESRETMERRMFGPAYDELIADGVNDVVRFRMTQIIIAWTFSGFEAAKAYLATGGKALYAAEQGGAPNGDPDPFGRGEYKDGVSDYYAYPEGHTPEGQGRRWGDILKHWDNIEADFQDLGIDLATGILRERSWRWFTVRVQGFINKPPVLAIRPGTKQEQQVPPTRLGLALNPIKQ